MMEYLAAIGWLCCAVAVVVAAAAIVANQQVNADRKAAQAAMFSVTAEMGLTAAIAADEKARLESVITYVKAELLKAEEDLAKAATPDAVRARLNGLFPAPSVPTPGGPAAGAARGGVLVVGTSHVGAGHVSGTGDRLP